MLLASFTLTATIVTAVVGLGVPLLGWLLKRWMDKKDNPVETLKERNEISQQVIATNVEPSVHVDDTLDAIERLRAQKGENLDERRKDFSGKSVNELLEQFGGAGLRGAASTDAKNARKP